MAIFDWFDAKSANAFGLQLAETFAQVLPLEAKLGDKKFSQKAEAVLKKMQIMIDEFKRANKLNFYKKAQLGNSFKWRLKDFGLGDDYINLLTEWLLERL